MVFVKVCGLTNYEDAQAALEAGADALGFIFFSGSPRAVQAPKTASWIASLPHTAMRTGVFVNASLDEIARTVELCQLDAVQLHGDEEPRFNADLKKRISVKVIRAVRPRSGEEVLPLETEGADYVLVDRYKRGAYGGTGETSNWDAARSLCLLPVPVILSGGLSAENVREACASVKPFGVDASSSLEKSPGIKDHGKVKEFIAYAKTALSKK